MCGYSVVLSFMVRGHVIACSSHMYSVWKNAVEMFNVQHIVCVNNCGIKMKYSCKIWMMSINFGMYKSVMMKELYTIVE
jgi:hypothetical protein